MRKRPLVAPRASSLFVAFDYLLDSIRDALFRAWSRGRINNFHNCLSNFTYRFQRASKHMVNYRIMFIGHGILQFFYGWNRSPCGHTRTLSNRTIES